MGEGAPAGLPVPDRLARAFEGRTTLTLREAATALEMDEKRLRAAVRAGRLRYVAPGEGRTRVRRRFLLVDLLEFLNRERRQECPSTSVPTPRSTGATSGSRVSDFAILRARLSGARPGSPSGR
jgi:hypothetical protein